MLAGDFLKRSGFPHETGWGLVCADAVLLNLSIPPRVIGVYLLALGRQVIYAGRSDHCLRTRLISHEHLGNAAVVLWRTCVSVRSAYMLEKQWYSRLTGKPGVLNKIEPAAPAGSQGISKCLEHVS